MIQRLRLRRDDDGNAIVEFVFLAVLLMVPLTYVLLTVFQVQRAAYAATMAAREAGRAYATGESEADGQDRARLAVELAMSDHGLRPVQPAVECSQSPCLSPGGRIEIRISTKVDLPFIPNLLGGPRMGIPVHSQAIAYVDQHRVVKP